MEPSVGVFECPVLIDPYLLLCVEFVLCIFDEELGRVFGPVSWIESGSPNASRFCNGNAFASTPGKRASSD
jgi:hypothetical protein